MSRGPFDLQFFHHNSNVMAISFCSHPNTNKLIATIFGTWHDSRAVVACANFYYDMITSKWIAAGLPTSKILLPYFVEKISVFLITFPYPLICSSSDSKQSLWQLPIYSGGTHWLPVETLVDSFGTTGTGSEEKRVTTTCGREKNECFGD